MSDRPIIEVENLGKRYRLGATRGGSGGGGASYQTLRESLGQGVRRLLPRGHRADGAASSSTPDQTEFWALRDVSFSVQPGKVVGIIGRNGAGKSTLLKILSRITDPTEGRVTLRGRVASLLEVGTGFHPELTGRENIYLNGAVLGMGRQEIKAKFDEIVAFAEVERFLDTPVKRYSSGMYVRLAFAVAAHLEPEILIVDEVLAVGDAEFQKKCLGKMESVAKGEGRTVLFVSHNIPALRTLCTQALVLGRGHVICEGDVSSCIKNYSAEGSEQEGETWMRKVAIGHADVRLITLQKIYVALKGQQPARSLILDVDLHSHADHKPAFLAVDILDASGTAIMQALPASSGFITSKQREHRLRVKITLPPLIPGRYFVTVWVGTHNTETQDVARAAVAFESDASPIMDRSFPHTPDHGYIVPLSTVEERTDETELGMDLVTSAPLIALP